MRIHRAALVLMAGCTLLTAADLPAPSRMQVGVRHGNRVLVPTNQLLDPAGRRVEFPQRPIDLAVNPVTRQFAVLLPASIRIFDTTGQPRRTITMKKASVMGLAYSPDGKWLAASQAEKKNEGIVLAGATSQRFIPLEGNQVPAGLAFDARSEHLFVALSRENAVARLNVASGAAAARADVGVAPLAIALTPRGDRLFVANWGGRRPRSGERTSPSSGTETLIDERGIASSGTVSVIDTATFKVLAEIPVGLHPGAVRVSPDGRLAAVANANSDSVTLIDTAALKVVQTVALPAMPEGYLGSSPTAVAFAPGGGWLYVACAGNNAVAVLERSGATYTLRGWAPVDWYPVALGTFARQGAAESLVVANSKGVGSLDGPLPRAARQFQGSVTFLKGGMVDPAWTPAAKAANTPFASVTFPRDAPGDLARLGIRHVFLIIKENRTYDQVFGDMPTGNGSFDLAIYGRPVTPNHHALASQFVLLDNFYTSGSVSADGHQWMTQAMASDYIERSHAAYPRSYPYSGEDPLVFAAGGFIWTKALEQGLSVRIFGEFTKNPYPGEWRDFLKDAEAPTLTMVQPAKPTVAAMAPIVDPHYPGFVMNVPDVFRARLFLDRFREYEASGKLPNLVILWLPTDHTSGKRPNSPTPYSMVADNDLAMGRVVSAITRSRFWPRTAIFITEDDSQNGVDHVDGHRTLCLVASPFVRRGVVDSTHYNQTSILRTIEELLGLTPMNKFDAAALPMRSIFTATPDTRPYEVIPNRVPLDEMNPPLTDLKGRDRKAALDSMKMNFSDPDAAPEDRLNRILWHMAKGWDTPYPKVPHHPWCATGGGR